MYHKPPGYNTLAFVNGLNGRSYVPYNGFVSAAGIAYGFSPGQEIVTLTFLAVPDDNTVMTVPDGPGNNPSLSEPAFTYDYGGAPGAGIIPLAVGGGTAVQAATATYNKLAIDLTNWVVTNPSAGVVVMRYLPTGFNLSAAQLAAITADLFNTGLEGPAVNASAVLATPAATLPGRFGKNYCFLPAT